jgi:hypothetical protein
VISGGLKIGGLLLCPLLISTEVQALLVPLCEGHDPVDLDAVRIARSRSTVDGDYVEIHGCPTLIAESMPLVGIAASVSR